jgi:hypothetical protein
MDKSQLVEKINDVQARLDETHLERQDLVLDFAHGLGTTTGDGINLTELGEWARKVIALNAAMAELADERRALRATKRELFPCTCTCH